MRVTLDATPLLGPRTGVGQYVAHLADELATSDADLELRGTAFTWRSFSDLGRQNGLPVVGRRAPARLLRSAWSRWGHPTVEALVGPTDVFHATNFVLPPTRRAAGVVTVHDLGFVLHADTVRRDSLAYQELVPTSIDRAAMVLTPSHTAAADLQEVYGTAADRIAVTPLGIDRRLLSAAPADHRRLQSLGLPERYLLFVGTREPRKNLHVLLDAHRALRADGSQDTPPLVLVGPVGWGAWGDNLLPRDGSVVVAGYLSRDDLVAVIAAAAALVMPSRYEGFGLPVLEALACGTPVVASDLPVLREVSGGHARFAVPGDVDALADAMSAVLADDGGAAAAAARRQWAGRWTWRRCAEATLESYRRASG